MAPTRIVMIRHAEKPSDEADGVDASGKPDPESLTPRGWQRAGALVGYFTRGGGGETFVPDVVFAAGIGPGSESRRSIETVTPLVDRLRETSDIPFVTDYPKKDHQALADDVAGRDGVVLIAWEHKQLQRIAQRVAPIAPGAPAPQAWPDDRFDLVWLFDREGDGWRFTELRQDLLAKDQP